MALVLKFLRSQLKFSVISGVLVRHPHHLFCHVEAISDDLSNYAKSLQSIPTKHAARVEGITTKHLNAQQRENCAINSNTLREYVNQKLTL